MFTLQCAVVEVTCSSEACLDQSALDASGFLDFLTGAGLFTRFFIKQLLHVTFAG